MPTIVLVVILILILLIGPFALIWGINTLFSMSLAYTVGNLLAAFVIMVVLRGGK